MSCCKCNPSVAHPYQPFPDSGSLKKNSNLNLNRLKRLVKQEDAIVYCYIIKSVKKDKKNNDIFRQEGCGPNWQGGLITLCTCKHRMRTLFSSKDWKEKWIAGFTSINDGSGGKDASNRKNALVYLMKVKDAFGSHHDLWYALPPETRTAKAAHNESNIHGDVFCPKGKLENRAKKYAPSAYYRPSKFHDHSKCWHKDVNYSKTKKHHPSLLVGDKNNSFLWNRPLIAATFKLNRGHKKPMPLREFYGLLCEV
jgi:hypothetical protein